MKEIVCNGIHELQDYLNQNKEKPVIISVTVEPAERKGGEKE